jgi:hypothetical protein
MKPLLTLEFSQTPEGVFVYCPELDIYTSGVDRFEAERKFASLIFEYYEALSQNREKLDEIIEAHLLFLEKEFFPQLLLVLDEYPRLARQLRRRFQTPERRSNFKYKSYRCF